MGPKTDLSRREFVKDAGGLIIGFSLVDGTILSQVLSAASPQSLALPNPERLDSWLRIDNSGMAHLFAGKADIGMGVGTAYMQIVAEELDVALDHVVIVLGDTSMTADQGGVGGSTSISMGAKPLRSAAATARFLLTQMASRRLAAPVDQLDVRNGIVSLRSDASKSVSYGELVGGNDLNDVMKVSGRGFALNVEGTGKPKDPSSYTIVGKSVPRVDISAKVLGTFQYVTDVRIPGMLHGRVIRPAGAGAKLLKVDEISISKTPGYVKTVVQGNFVGVVATTEWAAIRAAKDLKVTWSASESAFPDQNNLYEQMRSVTPKSTRETLKRGDAAAAFASAAKKVQASYDAPFQSHTPMGPGCAVADVHVDGMTTVWSGTQKPHALQMGSAELLGVPLEKVRVIWLADAGSYGRPGLEDVAADAILLSKTVGKPVRVQWMRADMTAWGTKAPAVVFDLSAALDAQGQVTGLEFVSRAYSGQEIAAQPNSAGNYLASQLIGIPNTTGTDEFVQWGAQAPPYVFSNLHAVAHILKGFSDAASPLRTSHMRDPQGPATTFAVESFMDELAAAAGADPIEFRLRYLDSPRAKAVLAAAAEKAGWDRRPSPQRHVVAGDIVTGRGISLGARNETYVGTIAEVEVNRRTGAVKVTRLVCAHDCGLIINPTALEGTIAANLIQSMSRCMMEEVRFDRSQVTTVDWKTYPVARASNIPPKVEIVLLNHQELPPGGAGEPSSRPTAAAIANAIFDASGARVRRMPLTSERVKAVLARIQSAKSA